MRAPTATAVLERAREMGVSCRVAEGRLKHSPRAKVTPELVELFRAHKREIVNQLVPLRIVHGGGSERSVHAPLRREFQAALFRGNRWLHRWHMENDAPPDKSPLFARILHEWYDREDAYQRLFDPDGCVLGNDGPCELPGECQVCRTIP